MVKQCLSALAASLLWTAPLAAAPAEVPIEAPGPSGPLRGTLLPGDAKSAPVLVIPGSGPTDRDGNNPLGVKAGSYKLLAEALAARGISTVRIDKRGMFGSAGAVADGNAVTVPDYAADVRNWVAAIRKRVGSRCVWLLGHSEGGLVALAAADLPDVCGLVLVAAPGRKAGRHLAGPASRQSGQCSAARSGPVRDHAA
jgi:pimeloyl-ACP methyl ester carboxylesterase